MSTAFSTFELEMSMGHFEKLMASQQERYDVTFFRSQHVTVRQVSKLISVCLLQGPIAIELKYRRCIFERKQITVTRLQIC